MLNIIIGCLIGAVLGLIICALMDVGGDDK